MHAEIKCLLTKMNFISHLKKKIKKKMKGKKQKERFKIKII